jgi:hypothetical protein
MAVRVLRVIAIGQDGGNNGTGVLTVAEEVKRLYRREELGLCCAG